MIPALKAASDPGGRQLLVSGRIADSISGRGLAEVTIAVDYDAAGSGQFRPLPALLARRDDGWFGFHLAPRLLPAPTGANPALRLSVSAPRHAGAVRTIGVSPGQLALATSERTIFGHPVRIERIAGAPFAQSIELDPKPVALAITVLVSGDPASPAGGATVELLTPPGATLVTDAEGRGHFAALPVTGALSFRVTRGPKVSQHQYRPDFSQPVNRVLFSVPA